MTQPEPYRPPTGSPRGWATREYDPHIVVPLAVSSVSAAPPTLWVGRDIAITVPAAGAIMAGETRLGVLPARFPFQFGNVIHQPVVTVTDNWVAQAGAGALAPRVWLNQVRPPAASVTATAPAPEVAVVTELAPPAAAATADATAPEVTS